jgi:NAD(P)-dependent dehydrogenase (short-subunit alcohol dehydrogenase family)
LEASLRDRLSRLPSNALRAHQMNPTSHDGPSARASTRDAVAIVTGGSSGIGRDLALTLAGWGWAIVVVYLEDQRGAEASVGQIIATGGRVVAVRADLADELDVERLFGESATAFGGVDVVVDTAADGGGLLREHAARHIRPGGAIVTVGRGPPDDALAVLDRWRQDAIG